MRRSFKTLGLKFTGTLVLSNTKAVRICGRPSCFCAKLWSAPSKLCLGWVTTPSPHFQSEVPILAN